MAETNDPVVRLNELIKGIDVAMLATVRPDGSMHSCPMAAHAAEPAGVLWFLSGNKTEKVEAIRTMQKVNLAYADHPGQRYVSVSGYCELVRDHDKIKELWDPQYESWFPGGIEGVDVILLKVDIQQVEYWDGAQGGMVELLGFAKPAIE